MYEVTFNFLIIKALADILMQGKEHVTRLHTNKGSTSAHMDQITPMQ